MTAVTKMSKLIEDLKNLCSSYDDESHEQMLAIMCGDEELDRGHSEDCYTSGVDDGENSMMKDVLYILKDHGHLEE